MLLQENNQLQGDKSDPPLHHTTPCSLFYRNTTTTECFTLCVLGWKLLFTVHSLVDYFASTAFMLEIQSACMKSHNALLSVRQQLQVLGRTVGASFPFRKCDSFSRFILTHMIHFFTCDFFYRMIHLILWFIFNFF